MSGRDRMNELRGSPGGGGSGRSGGDRGYNNNYNNDQSDYPRYPSPAQSRGGGNYDDRGGYGGGRNGSGSGGNDRGYDSPSQYARQQQPRGDYGLPRSRGDYSNSPSSYSASGNGSGRGRDYNDSGSRSGRGGYAGDSTAPSARDRSRSRGPPTERGAYGGPRQQRGYEEDNGSMSPNQGYPPTRSGSAGGDRGADRSMRPEAGGGAEGNFFDEIESAKSSITKASQNLDRIRNLQSRILSSTQSDETQRLTSQLDQLNDDTSRILQSVRMKLKKLSGATAKMPPGAESHARKGQQGNVAKKLLAVAEEYQKLQGSFKQKFKARMEREIRIARPDATPEEIERALDNNSGSAFSQQLLSSRNAQSRRALEEVQSRHKELQKIEQSMTELLTLFQDMQTLIETQQEMINTIETQVENTVQYVEEGSKEMGKAIVYRRNTRKKMWWLVALIAVIVIIVGIVVYIEVIQPILAAKNATAQPSNK
ncbi:Plasma membrane t-SNARE, secretory vesicle fusion [Blyttiomyces sp. JEL0837]|nr:Plasma membrane t-SNARE, secretory vesicle fusion [Blyttiomyces sp. JEL0837]